MMRCVGLIAALPREVKALVRGWERRESARNVWVWTRGNAVVSCAGMGRERGEMACAAAMDALPLTDLLSVGLAGGCDPELRLGEIVRAGVTIDAETEERFVDAAFRQVLVSSPVIASVTEKAEMHARYGAAAVDMEGATVARFAQQHGLTFRAIKAVSDEAGFEVAELSRFSTGDGQFREGAFALHVALRPAMWGKALAIGTNGASSLGALTAALRAELDWYEKQA